MPISDPQRDEGADKEHQFSYAPEGFARVFLF